ncbi:MAG TPA: tetratricopeptide repeat protein [Candidatus Sulfotelmatobacter sp.]|nr:tetratricopeptide repeat protein [Candidatus Sulfotelmatobacter sp.]
MSTSIRVLRVAFWIACLAPVTAVAQNVPVDLRDNPGAVLNLPTYYTTTPGTGMLVFTVSSERKSVHMDRQALLKLVNRANQSTAWQTTEDTSKAVFTNIPYGSYDVEVSAVGYLSAQKEVPVANSFGPVQIEIVLQRDPAALNLDVRDEGMSPKARKETKRAVSALKSSNLKEAQKRLDEAYKLDPTSADLNFLLGYLYYQKKDFTQAGTYLSTATNLNPHHSQALTLLGRTGLEQKDYPAARSALEQAILADAENWLPHNLLADAYLLEKNYDKARDEAQVAITKSKNSATPAPLVLGQALVGLGHNQEGIQALNLFLQQSPQDKMAQEVRDLITQVKEYEANPAPAESSPKLAAQLSGIDNLGSLPAVAFSVKPWQPASIDDVKLALAPGAVCPTARVIEESGLRVQELVQDVARFSAIEDLLHQPVDEFGNPQRTETRKYNYVASISEPEPGYLAVDEYRAEKITLADYPGHIASTGFAGLAFVFHPHVRDNFDLSCEGLGDWNGQSTWLVHFRQRDDRPNRMHSYKVGDQVYSVKLKGRAWITADKFQIVRIEAEMVSPIPEIQLFSEHQIVEYGPVPFEKKNVSLWLPKTAEIYVDFRKHRFYRRHSFDHYMLFSVDSEEKRGKVPTQPATKPSGAGENKDNKS